MWGKEVTYGILLVSGTPPQFVSALPPWSFRGKVSVWEFRGT